MPADCCHKSENQGGNRTRGNFEGIIFIFNTDITQQISSTRISGWVQNPPKKKLHFECICLGYGIKVEYLEKKRPNKQKTISIRDFFNRVLYLVQIKLSDTVLKDAFWSHWVVVMSPVQCSVLTTKPSVWMMLSTRWFHQKSTENNKHFLSLCWQMEPLVQLFSLCIKMKFKGWNVLTEILHVTMFISGMVLIQLRFNNVERNQKWEFLLVDTNECLYISFL